jgi:hypothetical protein
MGSWPLLVFYTIIIKVYIMQLKVVHNEKLHKLHALPYIVRVIEYQIRWAGEMRNVETSREETTWVIEA